MLNRLKSIFIPLFTILTVFLLLVGLFLQIKYIAFSDAAKFADVARTWLNTGLYSQSFSFWTTNLKYPFSAGGVLPVMPFSIVVFFKIFGVNDLAVIASSFFYFLLTLVFLTCEKSFQEQLYCNFINYRGWVEF
jgi:4-amino-4-deoxy-L-arabinose transferase-like glycosyltransferase